MMEGDEKDGNEKTSFPGLNKSHGFFSLIERNQWDRESYHQEQEEKKQARRLEVKKEMRNEKESRRRPAIALYRPPQRRQAQQEGDSSCRQFKLEVEVQPECWWRGVVQCGQESLVVDHIQKQYHLSQPLRDALLDMMLEFAQKS